MLKVLFLTTIIISIFADCPLSHYPRQTVLGSIQAQLNNNPSLHGVAQQFTHTLQNQIQQTGVSVALGIVGLQLNPNNKLDFFVQHLPSSQLNAIKFRARFNDGSYGWRSLRFSFIVSQSYIFQANSEAITQFSTGLTEGHYAIYRPLPNFSNFQYQPVIRVFISGITAYSQSLDSQFQNIKRQYQNFKLFSSNQRLIRLFGQAVQDKKAMKLAIKDTRILGRLLGISIQTNMDLKTFRFTYLMYSNTVLSQKHNNIYGDFSLINQNQHRISVLSNMDMLMGGLTQFKIPRDKLFYYHLAFEDYFGQGYFSVMSNLPYLQQGFSFMAFELKKQFVCQDCPNSPIIYDQKFCVESCPRGFSKSYRSNNIYCDKCEIQKLKVVDPRTGNCVCAKRHYLSVQQDTCKPCSYDCLTCTSGDRCQTCDNSMLQTNRKMDSSGHCSCPVIGYYDDRAAEDIVCHKCNQGCQTCNGPRAHDCLTCSSDKQLDSNNFCVCKKGYILNKVTGQCTCDPPSILFQGFCVDTTSQCGPNQTQQLVDLSRSCVCNAGYIQVLNDCIKCQQNSVFDNEELKCKCINKTVMQDGQCVACGYNKIYDEITQTCKCSGKTFQTDDGSCIQCPTKMAYINGKCQCIFNYFEARPGVCQRCLRPSDGPKCRRNYS